MYINAILNGLQGVFLFIVYCIVGKEVRQAIYKMYIRGKYDFMSDMSSSKGTKSLFSESDAGKFTASTNVENNGSESTSKGGNKCSSPQNEYELEKDGKDTTAL